VNDAHTEREWSIRDVQNLTNTLTNLDFDIKIYLTKEQLESDARTSHIGSSKFRLFPLRECLTVIKRKLWQVIIKK
jgi:hypothetical protein